MDCQAKDKQYVAGTYARFPVTVSHGKGSEVFDTDGKPAGKDFCVVLHRADEERDSGVYTTDNIEVYFCVPGKLEGKIYDLSTGSHFTAEEVGS